MRFGSKERRYELRGSSSWIRTPDPGGHTAELSVRFPVGRSLLVPRFPVATESAPNESPSAAGAHHREGVDRLRARRAGDRPPSAVPFREHGGETQSAGACSGRRSSSEMRAIERAPRRVERLYVFTLSSAFFVVRTKSNVVLQRRYSQPVAKSTRVRSDHTVILTAFDSAKVYPDALRRVRDLTRLS